MLPVFVRDAGLTQSLFRNDVVRLAFTIQASPDRPTHLRIKESEPNAVQVLDSIRAKHGKTGTVEGAPVFFPKSPEINTNVFAVEEKLQGAWDLHPGEYVNGRNKLISTRLRVKATGTFNEVDPNQANPQIFLSSPDSVQILEQ